MSVCLCACLPLSLSEGRLSNMSHVFYHVCIVTVTVIITIIIIIPLEDNVNSVVIIASHCESSLGSHDKYRTAPSSQQLLTKPTSLSHKHAFIGSQHLPSPFIIITQPADTHFTIPWRVEGCLRTEMVYLPATGPITVLTWLLMKTNTLLLSQITNHNMCAVDICVCVYSL